MARDRSDRRRPTCAHSNSGKPGRPPRGSAPHQPRASQRRDRPGCASWRGPWSVLSRAPFGRRRIAGWVILWSHDQRIKAPKQRLGKLRISRARGWTELLHVVDVDNFKRSRRGTPRLDPLHIALVGEPAVWAFGMAARWPGRFQNAAKAAGAPAHPGQTTQARTRSVLDWLHRLARYG
jgi:hypothetical protein